MAVARCCLQRAFTRFSASIAGKSGPLAPESVRSPPIIPLLAQCSRSYSSYRNSPFLEDFKGLTDYEVCKSPPEWKYVERLIPPKTVPRPIEKEEYPSGWTPQCPESRLHPYFVARNKNHMMPVYLCSSFRGMRKISKIGKIHGDIWHLAEDIQTFLKNKHKRVIALRVHELCGSIEIKGDFVMDISDYLTEKGF